MKKCNGYQKAFSLVEMLVVLTVLSMLMAFAAPNIFSIVSARTLSGEGIVLRNQLTLAQQIAVSKSADVEVRFFKWADGLSENSTPVFSAFQLYQYDSRGEMLPISEFFRIRAPTTVSSKLSTLLTPGYAANSQDAEKGFLSPVEGKSPAPRGFGGGKEETEFVSFRFRPDGSTDLPNKSGEETKDTWYITLVQGESDTETEALPKNYVCLQINPYNGVVSEFKPEVQ